MAELAERFGPAPEVATLSPKLIRVSVPFRAIGVALASPSPRRLSPTQKPP